MTGAAVANGIVAVGVVFNTWTTANLGFRTLYLVTFGATIGGMTVIAKMRRDAADRRAVLDDVQLGAVADEMIRQVEAINQKIAS